MTRFRLMLPPEDELFLTSPPFLQRVLLLSRAQSFLLHLSHVRSIPPLPPRVLTTMTPLELDIPLPPDSVRLPRTFASFFIIFLPMPLIGPFCLSPPSAHAFLLFARWLRFTQEIFPFFGPTPVILIFFLSQSTPKTFPPIRQGCPFSS